MFLRRFAIVTASLTFLLLIMGGLVHNTGSSLVCPDWPMCHGEAFPRPDWQIFLEHYAHRMVASTVGLFTLIEMVLLALRARRTRDQGGDWHLGALGVLAFAGVCAVGALGRYTVLHRLPWYVSTSKLALGTLVFALLVYLALRLRGRAGPALPRAVRRVAASGVALVYAQMVLGAIVRYLSAGLACPDVPLCHGQLWPTDPTAAMLLHVAHRALGLAILVVVVVTGYLAYRAGRGRTWVRALAVVCPLLVLVQITLGVLIITTLRDVIPLTAHLATSQLLLASLLSLQQLAQGRQTAPALEARGPSVTPAGVVA